MADASAAPSTDRLLAREWFKVPGLNSTIEHVWQLPSSRLPPRGLVLLAHGCRQTPRVWFSAAPGCEDCIARPEERCIASRLSAAGYALLAAGNLKGSKGCWETNDVMSVAALLHTWRRKHEKAVPARLPLFLLGPSSGGFFVTQAARSWRNVRALSVQISVPSLDDIRAPLPSGSKDFPPLQLVLMQRDAGKLHEATALRGALSTRGAFEQLVVEPRPVSPNFFSDAMPGFEPELSRAVRDGLVKKGYVDKSTYMIKSHPSRGAWRETVLKALDKGKKQGLAQHSLQVTMDGIFARLDLAYAYHASTCEVVNRTLVFFERHLS